MPPRIFKLTENKPINEKLDNLEAIQQKVEEIIKDKNDAIKKIRDGFVDCVVIFIDLVESTKFKIENAAEPETWILRVKQFGDVVKEYIENANGKVVKYIGDEVMGIFENDTQIDDALSLIQRIRNIEENLTKITGVLTQVKIALDYGKVFLIKYDGHDELDPQGTPIDRCARIGKHCEPGTVLSSFEFVSKCAFPKQWNKLGVVEMKGLGNQAIYQFGVETVEIKKKIEILETDFIALNERTEKLAEENRSMTLDKKEMVSTIDQLQNQLKEAGENPVIDTDFSDKEEEGQAEKDREAIGEKFRSIKKLIKDSGISEPEYGRSLFLNEKGVSQEYNTFKNPAFDKSIENEIVIEGNSEDRYVLNMDNRRNQKLVSVIDSTQKLVDQYIRDHGRFDEEDLFDYSFSDAGFWKKYLLINVS